MDVTSEHLIAGATQQAFSGASKCATDLAAAADAPAYVPRDAAVG